MGSIDKALPLAGFYPDSQKRTSDAAKVQQFFDIAKFTISFSLLLLFVVFYFCFLWYFSLYRRKFCDDINKISSQGDSPRHAIDCIELRLTFTIPTNLFSEPQSFSTKSL